tara:strand:+ start:292 stop:465 length:174 start_codon:yes stop_codon:yes gene_type:complete
MIVKIEKQKGIPPIYWTTTISDIVNGQRYKKHYIGYEPKECLKLFSEYLEEELKKIM